MRLKYAARAIGTINVFFVLCMLPHVVSAAATTTSFTAGTTWVVPSGVTSITVKMWGGGGGGGGNGGSAQSGGAGGGGGYATSIIAVTPGESLTIDVGGGGGAATAGCVASSGGGAAGSGTTGPGGSGGSLNIACSGPGGGGGGGSFVKRSSTILVAAGGGGGGGGTEAGGGAGAGGGGGVNGGNGTNSTGGVAGASATSAGVSRSAPGIDASAGGGGGGGYLGGGAGGNPTTDAVGAAGGGGGTNYGNTTVNGSGTTPGNSADSLRGSYGNGGAAQAAGTQGAIFITYNAAPTLGRPANNLGLVGYWSFEDATSTLATDFSGNGNTGTLSGSTLPSWVSGKLGTALHFDGVSGYVDAGSSSGPSSAITISAWIKKDADSAWASILDRFNGEDSDCFSLGLDSTNGMKLMFMWNGSSGDGWSNRVVANSDIPIGQWTHVVASSDGSTVTFYVNGVADGTGGVAAVCAAGDVIIGANFSGGDEYFDGSIDEVRLYSRALSASEVRSLYGTGAVRFSSNSKVLTQGSSLEQGLVGLYTFDGADAQWTGNGVAYDRSGNNRTATISGMTRDVAQTIGRLGQAFSFSGATSEYVQAGGFSEIGTSNQAYTMAAWVKPATAGSTGDVIHVSQNANGAGWCLSMLQVVSGKAFALSWPTNTVTGATTLAANQWYHLVHTWDATNGLRVFVNGALDGSAAQGTFSASGASNYVAIGSPLPGGAACASDAGVGLNGAIDDVRMYSRALSTGEISQLYRLGQVKMR